MCEGYVVVSIRSNCALKRPKSSIVCTSLIVLQFYKVNA